VVGRSRDPDGVGSSLETCLARCSSDEPGARVWELVRAHSAGRPWPPGDPLSQSPRSATSTRVRSDLGQAEDRLRCVASGGRPLLLLARRRRIRIVIESVAYSEGDTLAFGEQEVGGHGRVETRFRSHAGIRPNDVVAVCVPEAEAWRTQVCMTPPSNARCRL
jgi:hypothetical protein